MGALLRAKKAPKHNDLCFTCSCLTAAAAAFGSFSRRLALCHLSCASGSSLCDHVSHGRLLGQRVLLVTTGIGHDRAAVCLSGLLDEW
jgi:hypothetical protein